MGLIPENDRDKLTKIFEVLQNDVKLLLFSQEFECEHCKISRGLLEEVAALSGKIILEVKDFVKDKDLAEQYRIDKIPATVLLGDRDYGIRFFGAPAGYEFTAFVEDILDVSKRDAGLQQETIRKLSGITRPVHVQVLISPTCPYCAQAVRMAHRFAIQSDHIRADMVELTEFPHISNKYNVQGVPKVIINETHSLVGSLPENDFAEEILKALRT